MKVLVSSRSFARTSPQAFVQALEEKCRRDHPDLQKVVLAGDEKQVRLYQMLLLHSGSFPVIETKVRSEQWIPSCEGLRYLLSERDRL